MQCKLASKTKKTPNTYSFCLQSEGYFQICMLLNGYNVSHEWVIHWFVNSKRSLIPNCYSIIDLCITAAYPVHDKKLKYNHIASFVCFICNIMSLLENVPSFYIKPQKGRFSFIHTDFFFLVSLNFSIMPFLLNLLHLHDIPAIYSTTWT